jgi:hypothetical protein
MKNLVKILMTLTVIFTAINTSSAKVLFSEKVGGTNGTNFMLPAERFDILSTEDITRIAIQHGRRIEQIEIEYANRRNITQVESVGNDAGEWSFIELEKGEFITYITGRAGTLIDQITFHTSLRRTFGPYGGSGGQDFEINIPSNAKVIGFTGKVGPSIKQIGLIYRTYDRASDNAPNSGRVVRDHRTNGSGTTTGNKTAPIPTAKKIRDHLNSTNNTNYHPDSIGVMNYMLLNNNLNTGDTNYHPDSIQVVQYTPPVKGVILPIIEMNGRGNQEQEVKSGSASPTRKIRDHRKKND